MIIPLGIGTTRSCVKAWYGTREVPWPPVSTNCQSYFEETAFTVKTMTVARATNHFLPFDNDQSSHHTQHMKSIFILRAACWPKSVFFIRSFTSRTELHDGRLLVTCTVCWETRLSNMWTCWWARAHPSTTR